MGCDSPRRPEKEPRGPPPAGSQELWKYLGLGMQLALTVALFVWLGWWLDQHYGWSPWGTSVLGFLGVAAGLYHFLKDAM
ncbi:MAG: AtpZ/AtpI family protein, partial [Planctomycetota bacterium]